MVYADDDESLIDAEVNLLDDYLIYSVIVLCICISLFSTLINAGG